MTGMLEIEVKALRAALADTTGVVEGRSTIPVLSNVCLRVTPESLTVTGTDLDIWVTRHATLSGASAFETTVEASTLRRVIDKLPPDATCVLQSADGKLTVKAGRSRFQLPTLPAEDFPAVGAHEFEAEFEIPALTLGAAFGQVTHAISTEETHYYLNGVLLHRREAELLAVATDGHRLARVRQPAPDGTETLPDAIVPRKTVKLIDPLLGRHEGSIDVRVSASRIRFEIGETVVESKLIDGSFPDYTRVIPTHHEAELTIDCEVLIEAIGRVLTVSVDKAKAVKASLATDVLTLTVRSPEKGQGTEEMPCTWSGAPLEIGFNGGYLLDALRELTADTIEARLGDAKAPTLWRDSEDGAANFILMPMRV